MTEFARTSRLIDAHPKDIPSYHSVLEGIMPVSVSSSLFPENKGMMWEIYLSGVQAVSIERMPDTKQSRPTDFPRRILFEPTSICNLKCKMCPQQNLKRPKMHMDTATYMKVVDEIDSHGVKHFGMYHFGEALLHPNFKKILEHIGHKRNLGEIWLSTNGSFLGPATIEAVLSSNINYFNISVQAATTETYIEISGTEYPSRYGLDNIVEGVDRFIDMRGSRRYPILRVQIVDQEETHAELDQFLFQWLDKADIVSINKLEHLDIPGNASFGASQRPRPPLATCTRVGRDDCFIGSNGDVTLCDAAYNSEILLGNVNDATLYEIWNGPERKRLTELNKTGRMFENEFCRACKDYDL